MPYAPRTTQSYFQAMLARVQGRTKLKDIQGVLGHVLLAFAEELNGIDLKVKRFRDNFYFVPSGDGASEADVDDRTAELPGFKLRQPEVAASGDVMVVTRATNDVADVLTIPAGSVFGHKDNPNILYRTAKAYSLGVGVSSLSDIRVTCLSKGVDGNVPPGTITRLVTAPKRLLTATNTKALSSGIARETNSQVFKRVLAFLSGLAKSQPSALEYCALSFTATDGSRVKFANLFEDLTRPGYSELLIDDGSGLQGLTRLGAKASGIVPASGILRLWHEAPATKPIQVIQVTLVGGGQTTLQSIAGLADDFLSVPERGVIEIPSGKLAAGDLWEIIDYEVFTGLIAELQFEVEGRTSAPTTKTGWRAASTRVRVLPPTVQQVGMGLFIVPVSGVDLAALKVAVIADAVSYVGNLKPGEPLYVASLIAALKKNANLLNLKVCASATPPLTPMSDTYPISPKNVLRTDTSLVEIVLAPEA